MAPERDWSRFSGTIKGGPHGSKGVPAQDFPGNPLSIWIWQAVLSTGTSPLSESSTWNIMKFDQHEFWKHESCTDVFFKPSKIIFDDNGRDAILVGHWLTQGFERWFFAPIHTARIKITPKNYSKWKPYLPVGRIQL